MILFIFEGKNDEPRLYKTLKEIFHFELNEEEIIHYYCNNIFSLYDTLHDNKDTINQQTIFNKQIEKYVTSNHEVSVLNAFPLFWFEYIDEQKVFKNLKKH